MSQVDVEVMCYDVESGLSKALGKKVETFLIDKARDQFRFRIGLRWNLQVDRDQLETLWDCWEVPSALKEVFDQLKSECLGFQDYKR